MKRSILLILTLALTGCGAGSSPDPEATEGSRAIVLKEPDGVANVYFMCYGTVGIYVTEGKGDVALLNPDPHCEG